MWSLASRIQRCTKLELSQPVGVGLSCAFPLADPVPPLTERDMLDWAKDGWSKKQYHVRCDCGTHMDSPAHRAGTAGRSIFELTAQELVAPLAVLHVQDTVKTQPHYAVSLQDGLDYEARYGRIPCKAIVAAATGELCCHILGALLCVHRYRKLNIDGDTCPLSIYSRTQLRDSFIILFVRRNALPYFVVFATPELFVFQAYFPCLLSFQLFVFMKHSFKGKLSSRHILYSSLPISWLSKKTGLHKLPPQRLHFLTW